LGNYFIVGEELGFVVIRQVGMTFAEELRSFAWLLHT